MRLRFLVGLVVLSRVPLASALDDPPPASSSAQIAEASASPAPADAARPPAAEGASVEDPPAEQRLIYSVNRAPEPLSETGRAVEVLTAEDLWRRGARTVPEAIMEAAGVFVQQTNYGAGSPIIRGLIGKQVLILIDGMKLNNAVYRFGPLQYLATIDLDMVDRIEIVRGVGSVLGSDALGGVINVVTRRGPAATPAGDVGGRLASRFSSADEALTGRAEASGRAGRLRYLVGGTHRGIHDVTAGGSVGEQRFTGYGEWAGNLALDYEVGDDRTLSLTYLGLEQDDVLRSDRMLDGTNVLFSFDPQRLQMAALSYHDLTNRRWADSLRVTAYGNRQEEGQQQIRAASPNSESFNEDAQTMLGLNVELGSSLGASHRLVYGLDFTTEEIRSSREDLDLRTGVRRARRGQYTDGATYDTLAAYVQDRVQMGRWVTLTLGGRYGRFASGGSETSSVGTLDLAGSDGAFTGDIRAIVHATSTFKLVARASRGFRAPNIDDISVFDERRGQTEVPNPDVSPERVLTYEGGFVYAGKRLSGSAFYHHSRLSDLLVRAPGRFQGLAFFDANGNGRQDAAESVVMQRQNLGEATVHGLEMQLSWQPWRPLAFHGNFTRTVGDDPLANVPLSRIPPAFGTVAGRWSGQGSWRPWAELVYQFAGEQKRLSPSDQTDNRIGAKGTPDFHVLHARGGLSLGRRVRIHAALENLTDRAYKYHGSGVYRPGRQAVAAAEVSF